MKRGTLGMLVGGAVLAVVAGLGPVAWEATHSDAVANPIESYDDPRLERQSLEDDLAYVQRASAVVNANTAHCEPGGAQSWEVAALTAVTLGAFPGSEGVVHPRGLRCGLCSQRSLLLAEVLRLNAVPATAYGLDGHVVVMFEIAGKRYATDPDLGVPLVPVHEGHAAIDAAYDRPLDYDLPGVATFYTDDYDVGAYRYDSLTQRQGIALWLVDALRWPLFSAGLLVVGVAVRQAWGSGQPSRDQVGPLLERRGTRV